MHHISTASKKHYVAAHTLFCVGANLFGDYFGSEVLEKFPNHIFLTAFEESLTFSCKYFDCFISLHGGNQYVIVFREQNPAF